MSAELINQPVEFFLHLAKQLPGPLAPVSEAWEAGIKDLLRTNAPHVLKTIEQFLNTSGSAHTKELPLMNPFDVILIALGYLVVIGLTRLVMLGLPAFKLKYFAMLHNLFLSSLSAYMMTGIIYHAVEGGYSFWGNNYDSTPKGLPMAKMIWLFYVSKIVEFIDTLIMALKKNDRQISFLHVYHHLTIFTIWWLVTFMAPGGEAYYSAALNSFIHVVMYGYYLLSSLGVHQVVFIKHYITMMQMTQFLTMMIQSFYDLMTGGGGYPEFLTRILFFYMITLLGLFFNFLVRDKARLKRERAAAAASGDSKKEKRTKKD